MCTRESACSISRRRCWKKTVSWMRNSCNWARHAPNAQRHHAFPHEALAHISSNRKSVEGELRPHEWIPKHRKEDQWGSSKRTSSLNLLWWIRHFHFESHPITLLLTVFSRYTHTRTSWKTRHFHQMNETNLALS